MESGGKPYEVRYGDSLELVSGETYASEQEAREMARSVSELVDQPVMVVRVRGGLSLAGDFRVATYLDGRVVR